MGIPILQDVVTRQRGDAVGNLDVEVIGRECKISQRLKYKPERRLFGPLWLECGIAVILHGQLGIAEVGIRCRVGARQDVGVIERIIELATRVREGTRRIQVVQRRSPEALVG